MITRKMEFYSNCYRLAAALYLPDDYEEGQKLPCIIPNSGYMGLNEIYPALFARALTKRGFACFGFDYRGFLDNGGPAGVCKLDEQVEDIRNAVTFAGTLAEVDTDRIGLLGWGMAAGLVARAAELDCRVKAVAGLNGFYCGARWLSQVFSYTDFVKMKREIEAESVRLVKEGTRRFDNPFHFYPLDPDTEDVVMDNLYTVKGYGQEISLELGQSLMEFDAEKNIEDLKVPVFVGHGKDNLLHPISEAEAFFEKVEGEKTFYVIDGKHNDFMFDGDVRLEKLADRLGVFFGRM